MDSGFLSYIGLKNRCSFYHGAFMKDSGTWECGWEKIIFSLIQVITIWEPGSEGFSTKAGW